MSLAFLCHKAAAVSRLFRTSTNRPGCLPLTKCGIALGILLIPSPGLAQDDLHNGSALKAPNLKTVFVLDASGQETSGRLVELNADSLLLPVELGTTKTSPRLTGSVTAEESLLASALTAALEAGVVGNQQNRLPRSNTSSKIGRRVVGGALIATGLFFAIGGAVYDAPNGLRAVTG